MKDKEFIKIVSNKKELDQAYKDGYDKGIELKEVMNMEYEDGEFVERMTQRKFEKGEKYRPVVTVTKVKGNTPTVVEMSGRRYILEHKDQYQYRGR